MSKMGLFGIVNHSGFYTQVNGVSRVSVKILPRGSNVYILVTDLTGKEVVVESGAREAMASAQRCATAIRQSYRAGRNYVDLRLVE